MPHIRITQLNGVSETKVIQLLSDYFGDKYIMCFEISKKTKKPHWHIHVETNKSNDSIRKKLTSTFKMKGNGFYSVSTDKGKSLPYAIKEFDIRANTLLSENEIEEYKYFQNNLEASNKDVIEMRVKTEYKNDIILVKRPPREKSFSQKVADSYIKPSHNHYAQLEIVTHIRKNYKSSGAVHQNAVIQSIINAIKCVHYPDLWEEKFMADKFE